jgi:hypothetical protein
VDILTDMLFTHGNAMPRVRINERLNLRVGLNQLGILTKWQTNVNAGRVEGVEWVIDTVATSLWAMPYDGSQCF